MEALRNLWWSWSERVWAGAITMLSPVCIPIGSRFSILQMVIQLSALSRITSYSYSTQPSTHSSINTCLIRESINPNWTISSNLCLFSAMPLPAPPRVYAGRTITGNPPTFSIVEKTSSRLLQAMLLGIDSPISFINLRKRSRFSEAAMALSGLPSSSTPNLSSTPFSANSEQRLRAV
ncbi:hypothetical protein ES708_14841 [subsurface metagenome]